MNKTNNKQATPEVKTPGTRLLDLLAGWGNFVDGEQGVSDTALDAYEIAGMYQAAAAEIFELEGEAEAEAVRRWVLEKILPALLRTSDASAPAESVSVAA